MTTSSRRTLGVALVIIGLVAIATVYPYFLFVTAGWILSTHLPPAIFWIVGVLMIAFGVLMLLKHVNPAKKSEETDDSSNPE